MGMSKEEKAAYASLTAAIANLQNPKTNPAQDALTTRALAGANYLQQGEFSQSAPPPGQLYNFQMPQQQLDMYKKYANVNQGGTFALANNGTSGDMSGRTSATALQSKFLSDKFARDVGQNFQNNIQGFGSEIENELGQASGYQANNSAQAVNALSGLLSNPALKKTDWLGPLLGSVGTLGAAAMKIPGI